MTVLLVASPWLLDLRNAVLVNLASMPTKLPALCAVLVNLELTVVLLGRWIVQLALKANLALLPTCWNAKCVHWDDLTLEPGP
jgi:hypothetical protein